MELREKIAREMFGVVDEPSAFDERLQQFQRDIWLSAADRILAIPEIRDALAYLAELGPINHELSALIEDEAANPSA